MNERKAYPSDLSDDAWALIEGLIQCPMLAPNLPPAKYHTREIVNAILYRVRTGVQWRYLPHDLPPHAIVFNWYQRWNADGTLGKVQDQLRRLARVKEGRNENPTAVCIDSQSVKSTEVGGPHGYDGGKRVGGRKRHIIVCTLGLLVGLCVTPANVQDRDAAAELLPTVVSKIPSIKMIWVDSAYNGDKLARFQNNYDVKIETTGIKHSKKFVVAPRRWVVERTLGWLGRSRILSKEYERTISSSTANVLWASSVLMLHRLENGRVKLDYA